MSDIYYRQFNKIIVEDTYSHFLDLVANYCDSFSLYSFYGRQTWNSEDLAVIKKEYDSVSNASLKKKFKRIIEKHSESGGSQESNYLLQIPEYFVLMNNAISAKACNLSSIHSCTKYTFTLNDETLNWLKQFSDIFSISFVSKRMELSVTKDIFNSDSNEYELDNLSFERRGETVLHSSSERNIKINDQLFETHVIDFVNKVVNERISEFTRFRSDFEQTRANMTESTAIDFLSEEYAPIMFSPLLAVNKFRTCTEMDKSIINFYYDTANLKLLAKTFVKSVEINRRRDLKMCFSWFCEQEPDDYFSVLRPLKGECVITEYLKTVENKELVKLCDEELKDILLYDHDIFEIDRIIIICVSNGITANSFSPIIRELYISWIETYSEMDYKRENHAKQFLISWKFSNKLKRAMGRSTKRLYMKKFIERCSQSTYLSNFMKARIAYHYYFGFGVKRNYAKAVDWFKIVVDFFTDCQYDLAKCFLNGWGTEKDIEQAKYWFTKAAENGHPKAQEQLDLISKN